MEVDLLGLRLRPGDLAAAGHAEEHAMAAIAPQPVFGVSAPAANGFARPPPFAARPIFEGSAAAPSSSTDHDSTAPLTIIYAGSVHVFDSVPMEQAEKILYMTAKEEAQAAETPAFQQQPEPAAALAIPRSSAARMMMLLGLANANDSLLLPKRTASLARFLLHKRKQRVESAAAMRYPCGEVLPVPAQMDPSTAVYARDKAPSRDIGQPWGPSEDEPKIMKANHGEAEETVNTDLKI